ncbi:MAG TPA: S53 family peptidase [Candidatus Dormibacteraeota bacterium]|nr:S53 family peptidase [Candidatus Dormibacteraeota bacterium]
MRRQRLVHLLAAAALACSSGAGLAGGLAMQTATVAPHPFIHEVGQLTFPPTTAQCLAIFGIHCYQPFQLVKAYDLAPLHNAGIDGSGRTILIVDSFGSPTIVNDLHQFDATFGIPDPPSFQIRHDAGAPPPFDPTNGDMTGWAAETTLDVEWSHVFAPGANIVLEETPVSETEGVQGFPEIVTAENYAIDHGLADVISQSFGATEETFPNAQALLNLRGSFMNAAAHHVTVLGSSGDAGATDYESNLSDLYPMRVNSWPSSDPLVTSIGGTMLTLDDNGNRLQPDVVWNDLNTVGGGAGGGGVSAIFQRPAFQSTVKDVTGGMRGTPDISLSAAVDGAVVYYRTFPPHTPSSPFGLVAGTSEASPEFAGIVAMADQMAGQRLGNINNAMYHMKYGRDGLVDVTQGNNTFGPFTNSNGITYTVVGYDAAAGYDLASGLGTVDAAIFVPALARRAGEGDQ